MPRRAVGSDDESDFIGSDGSDDDFSAAPVTKKGAFAAPAAAKAPAKPRARAPKKPAASAAWDAMDVDVFENSPPETASASWASASRTGDAGASSKSVEETYQKKTQLEHILLRPDTYIGSVEELEARTWVLKEGTGENDVEPEMELRNIKYVPGLYKIFDEILVNAADNKQRDPSMDSLRVIINAEENTISVYNNGRGIPVQVHKTEGVYVPELIFGHLLTSSNYNDSEKKVTGGRNGFGAKLCNIFSTEFVVETADREQQKKYKQTFANNMAAKSKPQLTDNKRGEEWTKITFKPDLAKFGMRALEGDIVALLKKRVFDMAGCLRGVKVFLNGERVKVKDFRAYVNMYLKQQQAEGVPPPTVVYEQVGERWEVAVAASDDDFHQMSFVNSICTSKGGTHVEYVLKQLVSSLTEAAQKKSKKGDANTIKPSQVKNQLWLFVNCLVENPAFDSQTKENMTLRASAFGSKCQLPDEFIKKVLKCGVLERVLTAVEAKQQAQLKRTDGAKRARVAGIAKLDDANKAGTREAQKCTLILTEGDSAKALAVSGLSVVGRDYYGVFPLRGKLLNVRDAAHASVSKNAEVTALKQILGLQQGKVYSSTATLRYGHIMIMTDQDHDGSHIKGLIINMLDNYWPSLLKIDGFLCEFITPIVKCTPKGARGKNGTAKMLSFFTIPEYEAWRDAHDTSKFTIKYYKGLGTSDRKEAQEYFKDLRTHKKPFDPCTHDDRKLIDMAFNKKKADERKQWLAQFEPGTFMDHSIESIPIGDFINKELILFSIADNHRSIPSVVDGLKPGQRKILFACFKRNLKDEIKVAQLAGYVSEHSAYHHGEQSLCATVVNLAQDYVGSNNVYLLEPRGQFGTRLQGGADAASPRYIFTTLSPITRKIFHPMDAPLLKYLDDDGKPVEPEWYMPVLPMVLVNGTSGIGTGWSTSIPNHNPLDLIANLRRMLRGEMPEQMHPWYHGFVGTIEPDGASRYKVSGIMDQSEDGTTLTIRELPVGTWTQSYKEMLESYLNPEKGDALITDFREYHTDTTVHFEVVLAPSMQGKTRAELEKTFKLISSLSTSNMVCFDPQGRLKRYGSAVEILSEFFHLRLDMYTKRKAHLIKVLTRELTRVENRVRFIREVIDRRLVIERKKKAALVAELRQRGYLAVRKGENVESATNSDADDDQAEDGAAAPGTTDYDYLLGMPLYSLTEEKIDALNAELAAKKAELDHVRSQSPEAMWETDLQALEDEYTSFEAVRVKMHQASAGGKKVGAGGKGRKRAATAADSDGGSEDEFTVAAPKRPKTAAAAAKTKVEKAAAAPRLAKAKFVSLVDSDDDDAFAEPARPQPAAKKPQNTLDAFLASVPKPRPPPPVGTKAAPVPAPPAATSSSRAVSGYASDDDSLEARLARIRAKTQGITAPPVSGFSASVISPDKKLAPIFAPRASPPTLASLGGSGLAGSSSAGAPRKGRPPGSKTKPLSGTDSSASAPSSRDSSPPPAKPAAAAPSRPPPKSAVYVDDSSEEEDDAPPAPRKPVAARRTAAAARQVAVRDSDSDAVVDDSGDEDWA